MKILYDGQMFCMQKSGGINRYFTELICRLPPEFRPVITISKKKSKLFPAHANLILKEYPFNYTWPRSFWSRFEPYYFSFQDGGVKADIFHPTFYKGLSRRNNLKLNCPMVVTVWDMLHKHFPEQLDPDGEWGRQIKRTIESADAILCISNSTKNDLLKYYSVKPELVHVIHLASGLSCNESSNKEYTSSNVPYFLFVGGRSGYKNFSVLLKAFSKISALISDVMLYIAGDPFSSSETEEIVNLKLKHKINLIECPEDSELSILYKNSIALVYPSAYEGFGLPVLEALNCGTTVIASSSSSLPEVAGDAGILVDTSNPDELAEAMLSLNNDKTLRDNLLLRAAKQVKLFSWQKTADRTAAIYRSLV